MKVLIDGKEIEVQNDVRIIYDEVIYGWDDDDTELEGSLHLVANHEGLVTDVVDKDGEIFATWSNTYGELADRII